MEHIQVGAASVDHILCLASCMCVGVSQTGRNIKTGPMETSFWPKNWLCMLNPFSWSRAWKRSQTELRSKTRQSEKKTTKTNQGVWLELISQEGGVAGLHCDRQTDRPVGVVHPTGKRKCDMWCNYMDSKCPVSDWVSLSTLPLAKQKSVCPAVKRREVPASHRVLYLSANRLSQGCGEQVGCNNVAECRLIWDKSDPWPAWHGSPRVPWSFYFPLM